MSKTNMFNVLRWPVPDCVNNLIPDGLKVLKFEKKPIIIVWFKNKILVYDDIRLCELRNGKNSPGNPIELSVEGTIMNVLQLGNLVGVFNGCSLYLLVKTSDKCALPATDHEVDVTHKESVALRMHIKVHREVLAMCSLFMDFILVKKKHGKLYIDLYQAGPRMFPTEKRFSAELQQAPCGDVSCTLTSVRCNDLDPTLTSLLLEDMALVWSHVILVGLDFGQVYCVPVAAESKSTPLPAPKILYSTTQSIAGIVCLKDSLTGLYSHVGIVLRSGSVVYITSNQQKLSYHMVYLPGSVEGYCPVKDGIMATDGLDLWHSKLTWSNGGQPTVENSVMGIKGVCALDVFPDIDVIIVVTMHLTFYCVDLGPKVSASQQKNFILPPNIMADMDMKLQHLTRLKQEIAMEEKMLEAISITKRDKLLQNTFTLTVQVHDASKDSDTAQYGFEIHLKNNEDQDYSPEFWLLHVCITSKGVSVNQTSKLEQRVRKGVSLKTFITASIPEPFSLIEVSCNLVTKIPDSTDTEATLWAAIPVAATTLDVSYFLSPISKSTKSSLSENLLKIAHSHVGENMKQLDSDQSTEPGQHTYELRLLSEWATPHDVWSAFTKNSRHLFTEVPMGRELQVYVGCHCIKLLLNDDCNIMQLRCEDMNVFHHIKSSLAQLLTGDHKYKRPVLINRTILSMAQKLKADVQLEGKDLNLLREEWRGIVARHLPLQ